MKDKSKKQRTDDWVDDGRTIADMSLVSRRNLLIPHRFEDMGPAEEDRVSAQEDVTEKKERESVPSYVEEDGQIMEPGESGKSRPWERSRDELSPKETRKYIFSAMAAGLLLVLIFIAAGWLLIQLMLLLWT